MTYAAIEPDDFEWITRPGTPSRHVTELSETLGLAHTRANVWRYEPGAKGKRHRHAAQEEVFVCLAGTLTMVLGDEAERVDVPVGGVIRVAPGTPLQTVNHGDVDLLVYVHGHPAEDVTAEVLEDAV